MIITTKQITVRLTRTMESQLNQLKLLYGENTTKIISRALDKLHYVHSHQIKSGNKND